MYAKPTKSRALLCLFAKPITLPFCHSFVVLVLFVRTIISRSNDNHSIFSLRFVVEESGRGRRVWKRAQGRA